MAVFVVTCTTPRPELAEKIVAKYPNSKMFKENHTWILVAPSAAAAQVCDALGLVAGVGLSGILVARLQADYNGLSNVQFWDWMKEAFQADANG
jgi:hypothetical protein